MQTADKTTTTQREQKFVVAVIKLKNEGASIDEISHEDCKFEGLTHEIQDENGTSQVIVLKSLLDSLGKIRDL